MDTTISFLFSNRLNVSIPGQTGEQAAHELERKVERVCDRYAELMIALANEPSVGLYRVQEHVRRTTPYLLTSERAQMLRVGNDLNGRTTDLEASLKYLNEVFREDRPARRLQRSIERVRAASASLAAVQYELVPSASTTQGTLANQQQRPPALTGASPAGSSSPVRSMVQLEPYRKRERGAAETARDALADAASELSSSLKESTPLQ